MENHGKPWKTMENHGKPWRIQYRWRCWYCLNGISYGKTICKTVTPGCQKPSPTVSHQQFYGWDFYHPLKGSGLHSLTVLNFGSFFFRLGLYSCGIWVWYFGYDENHFSGVASLRPPFRGFWLVHYVQLMVNCLVLTTNWQGGPTHCQFNEFQTSPNHDPISVNDWGSPETFLNNWSWPHKPLKDIYIYNNIILQLFSIGSNCICISVVPVFGLFGVKG